jgi:hypothetical protein
MQVTVDGQHHDFIPIKVYREAHSLPPTFSIALFEPKDFTGLAAIDKSGAAMNKLRQAILNTLPEAFTLNDSLSLVDTLQAVFSDSLYAINDVIGLKVTEVEYAVAGFGDVLRGWLYAVIRAHATKETAPQFIQMYHNWLDNSMRLSHDIHPYQHEGKQWEINIVNNAYGRVGLRIQRGNAVDYVQDNVYACPAEHYMTLLLTEVATQIEQRLSKFT